MLAGRVEMQFSMTCLWREAINGNDEPFVFFLNIVAMPVITDNDSISFKEKQLQ